MTMARAIALLLLSGLIAAVGVVMLVVRINSGIVNPEIDSRSYGAGLGDNPATPTGSLGSYSGSIGATLTAVIGQATAFQVTVTGKTPVPSTPSTSSGGAVAVGQSLDLNGSRYTVLQVLDPEPEGLFKPLAGNRRVAIEVRQEAISARQTYNFTQFRLRDAAGTEHAWAITNQDPSFGTGALAAGATRQGWLSFQLPTSAALDVLEVTITGRASADPIVTLK